MIQALEAQGLRTVGDLARADQKRLAGLFGANGLRLHDLARGRDNRPVDPDQTRKGISAETTFYDDLTRLADLEDQLAPLCEKVARQARLAGVAGRVVTLKLKTADFKLITRRRALPTPTQTAKTLFAVARGLLDAEVKGARWRLIGVGIAELVDADLVETDLFGGDERRVLAGERTADAIRARFGPDSLKSARALRRKVSPDEKIP
jgi:DNA polymerase-4